VASGQAHRPDATLDELVVEVQALRAEMNQAAAASIRAQLLVGRLQMEDQRISGVVREMESVQADLASNAQARAEAATRQRELEDAVLTATNDVREEASETARRRQGRGAAERPPAAGAQAAREQPREGAAGRAGALDGDQRAARELRAVTAAGR
jgi:hypothetical protein